jgi:long-subunit fatty acid transport protein
LREEDLKVSWKLTLTQGVNKMRSKLSGLILLVFLFFAMSASGGQKFGPGVEVDTTAYFTIQNYLLSPFQLTDYNFMGGGARAMAMGGAFLAVSDDPTAASWNPAGLSQLDKAQMNLSLSSYMNRKEYASTLDFPSLDYSIDNELKHDVNAISFASVAIPFKLRDREIVGGVLYQKLADIYQENKYGMVADEMPFDDYTIENYIFTPIDEEVTGDLKQVNISLGGKLFESLSLGAGVNIYAGKFTSDVDFFVPYIDTTGLNGFHFRPHIETKYSGFNFTLGAMYKLDKLRLAGVVKTPYTLKEDNDVKLYTDLIELGKILETASILSSPFFETDRKWKMPTMFGFGTSYQINSLTLAADVEFRNYSNTEITYRRNIANPSDEEVTTGDYLTDKWWGTEGNDPPYVSSLEWRDLTQFRIGAEYVIDTKYGSVPLRIGFRNDPKLFTTEVDDNQVYVRMDMYVYGTDTIYQPAFIQSNHGTENGSWVNGKVFSLGTGIAWSQIKFDITYEFASYDDVNKEVYTGWVAYDRGNNVLLDPLDQKKFSTEEKSKYSRIMISFTGFF